MTDSAGTTPPVDRSRRPGPAQPQATSPDSGQITLLVIGFMLVLAALIGVVVTASRVFLYQRTLAATADGAAIVAANQLDESVFYAGSAGEYLPIEPERARQAVADYVTRADLTRRFDRFGYDVLTDGRTVTVTFTARIGLPLVGAVTDRYEDGMTITATALAMAPARG